MVFRLHPRLMGGVLAAAFFAANRADCAPGDLYVAEASGGGHVYRYSPAGTKSTVASGLYQPVALAFDRAGNLFVGNSGSCGCVPEITCDCPKATIVKIASDGTQSIFATLKSIELDGMAFDGAGNLFVSVNTSIIKIAPDGTQTTFASGLHGAWPLAFDSFGNLYVGAFSRSILKFAPDGAQSTFVTLPGAATAVRALAFGADGNLFAEFDEAILKLSPEGNSTTFATGYFATNSLAFDSAGILFAGKSAYNTTDPAILKFTPAGTASTFAPGVLLPSGFAFEPVTEKVRNISARGLVGGGDNTLIGGFIVGGSALANNAVVVRAIGPSLSAAGVRDALTDPLLELHNSSGAIIASNNDWQDTQKTQISATGLAPSDSRESAIYATLPAGNYTAVVRNRNQTAGTAVVEVYSVNQ